MPLLQHKICPECGKTAWHEMVNCGHSGNCYWVCRECGGRRRTPRVTLGPEYADHLAKMQTETGAALVRVLDISILGARLGWKDGVALPLEKGDVILFNPMLQPVGPLGSYRRATVRWVKNGECGIAFKQAIFASAADLLCIIKG